jgi:hypothetical protein
MIRRLKKNEYEIKRALSIKYMIEEIEVSINLDFRLHGYWLLGIIY